MTDPLAEAPDLPQGTPSADDPESTPAPPPGPGQVSTDIRPGVPAPGGSAPADLDADGQPWDSRYHVSPPRKNVRGRWAGKPGNAQRRKHGLPATGGTFASAAPPPAAPAAPDAPPAAPPEPPPQVSRLVWDEAPGAGVDDPAPVELRPREAYAATARSIVMAQFGIAQMGMGSAWEAEPAERKAWEQGWMDFMFHYQLPVVGPLLGLIMLAIDSIAKRRNDPETKERARALWEALWRGIRRQPALPPPPPGHAQPPPRQPEPADDHLRAYGR